MNKDLLIKNEVMNKLNKKIKLKIKNYNRLIIL